MTMVQSLAISSVILLFSTTPVNGQLFDSNESSVHINDRGVVIPQGRRTRSIEYDYENGAVVPNEYEVCPQVPSLHCKHGSTCTPGAASFGKKHAHLNLQTQESGYHCACPAGYIGHECEIKASPCDEKSCYHGATCKSNGRHFFCDCETANAESGTKFSGTMCQHESTSMCAVSLVGNQAPHHQFCTNHGTCLKLVTSGEPHPGCVCTDGWMGDHCEIRRDPFAKVPLQTESQSGSQAATAIALLFTTVLLLAIFIAAYLDVKKKRSADVNKGVIFKGPTFTINDAGLGGGEGASLPTPAEHRSVRDMTSERELNNTEAANDVEEEGHLPETELV